MTRSFKYQRYQRKYHWYFTNPAPLLGKVPVVPVVPVFNKARKKAGISPTREKKFYEGVCNRKLGLLGLAGLFPSTAHHTASTNVLFLVLLGLAGGKP